MEIVILFKNKLKTQIIALILLFIYNSVALNTKLLARSSKLYNNLKSAVKTDSNSEKNYLEYFSKDDKKFEGKLIYDFGFYGLYYSNSTNMTILAKNDFGVVTKVKKLNDKANVDYTIKIFEDIDEKVYRSIFQRSLALILQHTSRPPNQAIHYLGVKTYMKNFKKSLAIVMNYVEGRFLYDVIRDPKNYLTSKQHIMNLIYTIIKAVHEFHTVSRRTHYDIRPQTILIVDSKSFCQRAVLINLESSLTAKEETFHPIRIFTKFYTSPKFSNDKKEVQRFTDVYALGIVVLQTLANLVGVHMKYSQKHFYNIQEKYIEEINSNKDKLSKFLTNEEFQQLITFAKSFLNHQSPKVILEIIENKFVNFICRNNN